MIALRPSLVAFSEGDGRKNRDIGRVVWNGFGREVLGCNFAGVCETQSEFIIRPVGQYLSNPIMNGLENMIIKTKNPLYRIMPLSLTATPLLMSERQEIQSDQIVAWTNISYDSKVFIRPWAVQMILRIMTFSTCCLMP